MVITHAQLLGVMPGARLRAGFLTFLNAAFAAHQINTARRVAAFLAQVGHESAQLQYVRELGSDQYLSKYDTGSLAARLGNTPKRTEMGKCIGAGADPDHRAPQLHGMQPSAVR